MKELEYSLNLTEHLDQLIQFKKNTTISPGDLISKESTAFLLDLGVITRDSNGDYRYIWHPGSCPQHFVDESAYLLELETAKLAYDLYGVYCKYKLGQEYVDGNPRVKFCFLSYTDWRAWFEVAASVLKAKSYDEPR